MKDKQLRSIVKAVSYRVTGTLATVLITFIVTRKVEFALSIAVADVITKIIIYYVHERAWDKVKLGKVADDEYNI
ncbi:MAG: hypothetical protein FD141_1482 [Fusobacteria bacterium]|nr:MAG: hypothetical protein FD141_1482 [Fusobacteriota bacterium]KAF0230195.1 MAG: hypothetical protein FD182_585 [Fusobacteriota bacterium]